MKTKVCFQKFVAVALSLCIALSMTTVAISSVSAADTNQSSVGVGPAKPNAWAAGAKSFGINKVYSTGLLVCGTALVKIAGATDCEEFQAVASFINKWVCGGGQGQTLGEIKQLCQQILAEVQKINRNLTDYTTEIERMLGEQNANEAIKTLNDKWQSDVLDTEKISNIGNVRNSYYKYMQAASDYDEGKLSFEDVENARMEVFDELCDVYTSVNGGFSDAQNNYNSKRDIIFSDTTIYNKMRSAIQSLSGALNNSPNYADVASQCANKVFAFSDEQYDFIINYIDRQFTEIVLLEMACEEYFAQRGEYLEEKYPDDKAKWESYKTDRENFENLNVAVAENMENMLGRDLNIDPINGIRTPITNFLRADDVCSVNLKNNNHIDKVDFYGEEQALKDACFLDDNLIKYYNEQISEADSTKSGYTKFIRNAVVTNKGVEVFYIMDGEQYGSSEDSMPEEMHLLQLDHKINHSARGDEHLVNCDFFNLTRGEYTDTSMKNTFSCVESSGDLSGLFSKNRFSLVGRTPSVLLSRFLGYTKNCPSYLIFPDWEYDPHGGAIWDTGYERFNTIALKEKQPSDMVGQTWIDAGTIQADKDGYESAYSVILKNNSEEYYSKVDLQVNGDKKYNHKLSDMHILDENGNWVDEGYYKPGTQLKIEFKGLTDDTYKETEGESRVYLPYALQSVRHNDAENPSAHNVSNDVQILGEDEIATLPQKNGYYCFEYTVPYSDSSLNLRADTGYNIYTMAGEGASQDSSITIDGYSTRVRKDTTVNFIANGNINKVVMEYTKSNGDKVSEVVTLKTNLSGEKRGSFKMPWYDCTLIYYGECDHLEYNNGFCTACGKYEPAVQVSGDNFEIYNGGQFFWFNAYVQGDSVKAPEITEPHVKANAAVKSDIFLENREWTAADQFSGRLNGEGHSVTGFNSVKGGLFKRCFDGFCVENLSISGKISDGDSIYLGTVSGIAANGSIKNVYADMDIVSANENSGMIGGIAGYLSGATVEHCSFKGSADLSETGSVEMAGIAVSVLGTEAVDGSALNKSYILNCYSDYTGYGIETHQSSNEYDFYGIAGNIEASTGEVNNCFNYGSSVIYSRVTGKTEKKAMGVGDSRCSNTYYLGSGKNGIGKTAEQFASGEVAYLLNKEVTNGSQAWYQNLDNGKTPDIYPVFEGGTVYRHSEVKYSNYEYEPVPEPDEFDNEDGEWLIKTYEDLEKLSQLVMSDYETYGDKAYRIANNIFAPSDSVWSQGIGTIEKPFNGTLKGDGYIVSGFNVNSGTFGGLFEAIGESGSVEDLIFVNCDYVNSSCETAGGIAAVNNGTITNCLSGANLSVNINFNNPLTNESVTSDELNSDIKGKKAGGVAAVNNGAIIASRNASVVTGTVCGGIAAENNGTIYACANNGAIGAGSSTASGGVAGKNSAVIEASYSSGTVRAKSSGAKGAIAGESAGDAVVNNFYTVINGVQATGQGTINDTNVNIELVKDMQTDSFNDMLNAVTDGDEWIRSNARNKGFPTIKSRVLKPAVVDCGNGITVKGTMHSDLKLAYTECNDNCDECKKLRTLASGGDYKIYKASITDKNGVEIPFELWSENGVELSARANGNVKLYGLNSDNEIVKLNYTVKDGRAYLNAEEPIDFIMIDKGQKASADEEGKPQNGDNSTVATGESGRLVLLAIMLLAAGFAGAVCFRRKEDEQG